MNICFTSDGWADYTHWQQQDKKTLKKINSLLRDIVRDPQSGTGSPEALRGDWSGWWSRVIDSKNRLIYRVIDDRVDVAQCAGHYDDH